MLAGFRSTTIAVNGELHLHLIHDNGYMINHTTESRRPKYHTFLTLTFLALHARQPRRDFVWVLIFGRLMIGKIDWSEDEALLGP